MVWLLETEKEKCEVEGMLMVCLDGLFGWCLVAKQISRFDSTSIIVYFAGYNIWDSV